MKTIRNISLLTIVAVINFSCSDDPIDPINSSESFTGELSLTTDRSVVSLNVYGEDIPLGGNAQINLSGQGTSDSDLMPQMSFEGSHKESYDWTSKSSIIKEGEFVLKDDFGNQVFGTYNGKAEVNGSIYGSITGGTGEFAQKQGTLTLAITGYTLENDDLKTRIWVTLRDSDVDPDQF